MGTEDWILKGTKIDNKNQKAKIKNLEQRLDFQKYNIEEKKKKKKRKKRPQELLKIINNNHAKTIYGVCLKKYGLFFLKSNSRLQK